MIPGAAFRVKEEATPSALWSSCGQVPPRGGEGDPAPHSLLRVSACHDVGAHGDAVGARSERERSTLSRYAADGDESAIDLRSPFGEAWQPLRRPRHRLESRRIDGTERDIVGRCRKCHLELFGRMGAHAEPDPGCPNGRKIGRGEILLAEMHETCA